MRATRTELRFAYNTNGLQSHRLDEALDLLADSGYAGVALTLDHMHLDPLRCRPEDIARVRAQLRERGLAVSIETGARYVLDPRRKHRPSWLDAAAEDRKRRSDYLRRCLVIAAELEAESLVLFSGVIPEGRDPDEAWAPFIDELAIIAAAAEEQGLPLALEPEPGHAVATLEQWRRAADAVDAKVGLALDVGHVPVSEPGRSIPEAIRAMAAELRAVHLEDSRGLVHEHRPFGEGSLDIAGILAALVEVGYDGLAAVELSRHSHAAHELVPASIRYLRDRAPRPS